LQAIHAGHLHIESDDVWREFPDLLEGIPSVPGTPHYLDAGIRREKVSDHLAHESRIIDDKYAYPPFAHVFFTV
jgi:hypothetical protein